MKNKVAFIVGLVVAEVGLASTGVNNKISGGDGVPINYDGVSMSAIYPLMPPADVLDGYSGKGVFGHSDPDQIVVRETYGSWDGFPADIQFEIASPKKDLGGVTVPPKQCVLGKVRINAGTDSEGAIFKGSGTAYDGGCFGHRGYALYEYVVNVSDRPPPGLVFGRAFYMQPMPFDLIKFSPLESLIKKVDWKAIKDASGGGSP